MNRRPPGRWRQGQGDHELRAAVVDRPASAQRRHRCMGAGRVWFAPSSRHQLSNYCREVRSGFADGVNRPGGGHLPVQHKRPCGSFGSLGRRKGRGFATICIEEDPRPPNSRAGRNTTSRRLTAQLSIARIPIASHLIISALAALMQGRGGQQPRFSFLRRRLPNNRSARLKAIALRRDGPRLGHLNLEHTVSRPSNRRRLRHGPYRSHFVTWNAESTRLVAGTATT